MKELLESIPDNWAPLSEYSKYNINEYFKQKTK
jgi:hypothetical protein